MARAKVPKVLLVDDEPDFLLVMEKLLRRHGYAVVEAIDGKGALRKAREESPDAVLLDVMMPDINGWEVCRKLKNSRETRELPVIMLTVMAEEESVKKSFDYAGADWHVSKPFDSELLFLILDMAAKREDRAEIEERIKRLVEKEKRMKKVLEMINPKLLEHKYDFLKR